MNKDTENIKLILFDLGGVLIELGEIAEMWADRKADYAGKDYWKLWLNHDAIQAIDCGKMDVGEFLRIWANDWELDTSLEELGLLYSDLVRAPYPGAIELVQECRRHYSVACLSNMTAGHWPKVKSFGLSDCFDYSFISFLTGTCKPNRRAYEIVLEQCDYEPQEILFIDDNATNLNPAQELGFNVLESKTAVGTRLALVNMGLL